MSKELRLVFDDILKEWGHDILLQRVLNPFEANQSPRYTDENGDTVLERHTVRHTYPGSRALGSVAQEELEGVLYKFEYVYYFRHSVNPISGDRIYENLERYPNDLNTFIIDAVIPMRGKGGMVVYWIAGVTRETP